MAVPDWKSTFTVDSENMTVPGNRTIVYASGKKTEVFGNSRTSYKRMRARSGSKSPAITKSGVYPWRAPTNYERFVAQFEVTPGVWTTTSMGTYGRQTETRTGLLDDVQSQWDGVKLSRGRESVSSNLINRASTEAMLKIGDQRASWGANLGEAVSAASKLGRLSSDYLRLYRDIRRLQFQRILRRNSSLSANYLRIHFGLEPLMNDLEGTYGLLVDKVKKPLLLEGRRVIASDYSIWKGSTTYFREVEDSGRELAMCSITAKVNDSRIRLAAQLGLTSPASVAWEIVPWSFLIDWFLPIGNMLAALDASNGVDFMGGSTTSLISGVCTAKSRSFPGEIRPAVIRNLYSCHRRTALGGFPFIRAYYKSPFSTNHVVTALALYRQLTR